MNQKLNIMKTIKRVSLVIVVVFALGACNQFDEGLYNVTEYPSNPKGIEQNDSNPQISKIEKFQNSGSTLDDNIE